MITFSLLRSLFRFSLSLQEVQKLASAFEKKPQINTFGHHYTSQNVAQIYNIVTNTNIPQHSRMTLLKDIQQNLCKDFGDQQLNILANIARQKAMMHLEKGNIETALIQMERAIKALTAMQDPFGIQLAEFSEFAASLCIKRQDYQKAKKWLTQAQNAIELVRTELQDIENIPKEIRNQQTFKIQHMLAKIHSKFCLTYMQTMQAHQARKALAKSLQHWQKVEPKHKQSLTYLLTIKFKCILHIWVKENSQAIQTAMGYLNSFQANPETRAHRLWFMKFLHDLNVQKYKDELTNQIQQMAKQLDQNQLKELLMIVGVIKKEQEKQKNKKTEEERK